MINKDQVPGWAITSFDNKAIQMLFLSDVGDVVCSDGQTYMLKHLHHITEQEAVIAGLKNAGRVVVKEVTIEGNVYVSKPSIQEGMCTGCVFDSDMSADCGAIPCYHIIWAKRCDQQ